MTTSSKVEIANLALQRIGERAIQSFESDTITAKTMERLYDRTRTTVLRQCAWRFAMAASTLSLVEEESPIYEYVYAQPVDTIKIIEVLRPSKPTAWLEPVQYELFGDRIHTNQADAVIRYIRDEKDPNKFDEGFIEAFAWKLAADAAVIITGKADVMQTMLQGYAGSVAQAQSLSASESRKPAPFATSIVNSRVQ